MTTESTPHFALDPAQLDFDKGNGLLVMVAQDAADGAVLMVAFADREAVTRTLETGELHFFSRRRGLWKKGETSGNTLRVVDLRADCDGDAIVARVVPAGPACHTGATTCFGEPQGDALRALERVIQQRAAEAARPPDPDATQGRPSYTRRLLADRNLRLKKLGEESTELVVALADGDKARAAEEAADVVYHVMVALRASGVEWADVLEVLRKRAR
ncbi:bifunctional phosphoribosyl-AMP cyclohydrolase/phosphoribosyl-ATP diphosphatase HisIE [Pendulispora albinea]|uniref:Histidine biosynthesis bifunctional protein HisIE n=1 Tax=Pendulispora albinea TaxID=2741071 RepID=A0ABZ2M6N4_9BACT